MTVSRESRTSSADAPSGMASPVVTIRLINGLDLSTFVSEILGPLAEEFAFIESVTPRLCVAGPYGTTRPPAGSYHVGYLCENIWPEPSTYDWCFGTWDEDVVRRPNYTRITWHGFDARQLIKTEGKISAWLAQPRQFCNFFYSNSVPYRERFCRALAQYRAIDCPGSSLRNMPAIDDGSAYGKWDRKRAFLANYRFTIAFENSSAPGYQTEKILDPMMAGSIPIYRGNPGIAEHFNPRSFIDAQAILPPPCRTLDRLLRRLGRRTLRDYCPGTYAKPRDRVQRRLRRLATQVADLLLSAQGWRALVDYVREIDCDRDRYESMLHEPWFPDNRPPADDHMRQRWRHILQQCATA